MLPVFKVAPELNVKLPVEPSKIDVPKSRVLPETTLKFIAFTLIVPAVFEKTVFQLK